jgi:hypothetical protein
MINQFAGAVCSQNWAQHIANGITDHGDDELFAVGTPIVAPFSGTVRNHARPESAPFQALYITTITSDADPSVSMEFMHLSQFVPEGHYAEGDTIGLSGGAYRALGSGRATGPHIHVNSIINGVISPYTDAFAALGTTTAGTGTNIPITPTPPPLYTSGDTMKWAVIKDPATGNLVGLRYGELSALYVNNVTDPEEFAASELALGSNAPRVYITQRQANIELAQIAKNVAQMKVTLGVSAPPVIDAGALAKAIAAQLTPNAGAVVDIAAIVAAVEAALAPNFAAIPAAVANEESKRLQA